MHIERIEHLLERVFPLAEAKAELGLLDFEGWRGAVIGAYNGDPCGTHACLFGWAMETEQLQADGWVWDGNTPRRKDESGWFRGGIMVAVADYYGLSLEETLAIFDAKDSLQMFAATDDEVAQVAERYEISPVPYDDDLDDLYRRRDLVEAMLAEAKAAC